MIYFLLVLTNYLYGTMDMTQSQQEKQPLLFLIPAAAGQDSPASDTPVPQYFLPSASGKKYPFSPLHPARSFSFFLKQSRMCYIIRKKR